MKLEKADKRDKARQKKKSGMRIGGRSVFTIQEVLIKRSKSQAEN